MNRYQVDIQSETVKADILIVDDSADNLRVLSVTLTQQGYTVRCVKSGAMALLGGEMYVRSTPGEGTSFSFDITVQRVESASIDPAIAPHPNHAADLPEAIEVNSLIPPRLTAAQLQAALPIGWIEQIHQAALKGSDQAILDLIQTIPTDQATIAETLFIWVDNFRFDEIIQLTQPILAEARSTEQIL